MNVQFMQAPGAYSSTFFNQLIIGLQRTFASVVSKDEETPRIVLRSQNGTLYDLTVSNAGVLTVTPTSKTRA